MAEPDMIYRMTVLALLRKSDRPMTNESISAFFHDTHYTDYLTVQETLSYLLTHGLAAEGKRGEKEGLFITEEGKKALSLFSERVTPAIQKDIRLFFERNGLAMRRASRIQANYDRAEGGGFIVRLSVIDEDRPDMKLEVLVPSREEAEAMCMNWKARYEEVFASLVDILST